MIIEVKNYTYETMPDYDEYVDGATEIKMSGNETEISYIPDVVYDHKDGVDLHLQLLIPICFNKPDQIYPCVAYVQGSGWMKQNVYDNVANLGRLASRGYVCAIIEYRHSGIAHFPAQIIDAKNAIRFLKANHEQYHLNPDQVIIMGGSSGGHTCTLAGMTAHTKLLDDPINEQNCHVQGIINQYGAVEVTLPYGYPCTLDHQLPTSPEGMLMGYNIREHEKEAEAANALSYVSLDYAPLLMIHGTKDRTVFCEQSVRLYRAMKEQGKEVELCLLRGADHGGPAFWMPEVIDLYDKFIRKCLNFS